MKVIALHRVERRPDPKGPIRIHLPAAPGRPADLFDVSEEEFKELIAAGAIKRATKTDAALAEVRESGEGETLLDDEKDKDPPVVDPKADKKGGKDKPADTKSQTGDNEDDLV
jgi:hypothetical protein